MVGPKQWLYLCFHQPSKILFSLKIPKFLPQDIKWSTSKWIAYNYNEYNIKTSIQYHVYWIVHNEINKTITQITQNTQNVILYPMNVILINHAIKLFPLVNCKIVVFSESRNDGTNRPIKYVKINAHSSHIY